MDEVDVVVIGGGMAGASIGYELAADRTVVVLDMEDTFGHHTTGRSAAMYLETYGGPTIRGLTTASRAFLSDAGVLSPLPYLHVALSGRLDALEKLHADVLPLVPDVELIDAAETARRQPLLRAECVDGALSEPDAMEIDVAGLHQHYLRGLRERGGTTVARARPAEVAYNGSGWTLTGTDGQTWRARAVVDAAGAWADETAALFGAEPVGLQPLRRSAFMVDAPPGTTPPMVSEIDDTFYFKPDAGRLLCSPADETPRPAEDARPDELEIARAIEVINEVTTLDVRHVRNAWAGLRTFVADRTPVVGADGTVEGFFWFAGQGGYGIQCAPALARTGAALLRGEPVPSDAAELGVTAAALAPERLRGPR